MAVTQHYVDPSGGSDGGDGLTVGTAFTGTNSALAYAISQITPNITDGDELLVLDTATDTQLAALDCSSWANSNPLFITGVQSDGSAANYETGVGMTTIDLNGGAYTLHAGTDFVRLKHLHVTNGSGASLIDMASSSSIFECYVSDAGSRGIDSTSYCKVIRCKVWNCGTDGISGSTGSLIIGCYVKSASTDSNGAMDSGISTVTSTNVIGNIVSVDGATVGIDATSSAPVVMGNSVLSTNGTGKGVQIAASATGSVVVDNVIEGYSGSGGKGVDYSTNAASAACLGNNSIYNCSTLTDGSPELAAVRLDDITLLETPFAKSGTDTFANRKDYFAPRSVVGRPYLAHEDV